MGDVKQAIILVLSFLNSRAKTVNLKPEQETAVGSLLRGESILAVLPAGFGKNMIFSAFARSFARSRALHWTKFIEGTPSFIFGRTTPGRHFHWEKNFLCTKRDLNPLPPDYHLVGEKLGPGMTT